MRIPFTVYMNETRKSGPEIFSGTAHITATKSYFIPLLALFFLLGAHCAFDSPNKTAETYRYA